MPKKSNKMMSKEDAESFLYKVDMEGLSYAVENYAPHDTGDKHFDKLLHNLLTAQTEMKEYIEKLRDTYDIEVS